MGNYDSLILEHYRKVAVDDGLAASSTMADSCIREKETQLILDFAMRTFADRNGRDQRPVTIFDIGCGNGFTLSHLASSLSDCECHGFEFTPELRALAEEQTSGLGNAKVHAADIRESCWNGGKSADIAIVQRVLINLMDPEDQAKALQNIADALKQGGFVLFIEAFGSGLDHLNEARAEFELPPIPPAEHNLLLSDNFFAQCENLVPLTLNGWSAPSNFLSTHYFVARVLHPIALGDKPLKRNSHFVTFLSSALDQMTGDYAPVKAFAFKKSTKVSR